MPWSRKQCSSAALAVGEAKVPLRIPGGGKTFATTFPPGVYDRLYELGEAIGQPMPRLVQVAVVRFLHAIEQVGTAPAAPSTNGAPVREDRRGQMRAVIGEPE